MTKKDQGQEPREAAKDEVLSRRMAIKRIAAGLAGAGAVVVAGLIFPGKSDCSEVIWEKPYGDSGKLPYRDKAPI